MATPLPPDVHPKTATALDIYLPLLSPFPLLFSFVPSFPISPPHISVLYFLAASPSRILSPIPTDHKAACLEERSRFQNGPGQNQAAKRILEHFSSKCPHLLWLITSSTD